MLTGFGLASAAFSQAPPLVNRGGLFQRACVTTGFAWLTALAMRRLRGSQTPQAAGAGRPKALLLAFIRATCMTVRCGGIVSAARIAVLLIVFGGS